MLRNLGQICGQVRHLTADRSQHNEREANFTLLYDWTEIVSFIKCV